MRRGRPSADWRGTFHERTRVTFTPQARRALTMDVAWCPHCGGNHASLDATVAPPPKEDPSRFILTLYCPALGGRPLTMTLRLFPHPL